MFTSGAPDLQSLMQLLDAAQMGWWKADFRTGELFFSDYIVDLLGLGSNRAAVGELMPLTREDYRTRIHNEFLSLKVGNHFDETFPVVLPEGEIWIHTQLVRKQSDPQQGIKLFGYLQRVPVAGRKEADVLTLESNYYAVLKENKHMDELLDHLPIGYFRIRLLYDDDGQATDYLFLSVNQTAQQILGVDAADYLDKTAREIDIPVDRHIDELAAIRLGDYKMDQWHASKTGRYCRSFLYNTPNDATEIVILILDITDVVTAHQALDEKEKLLRNVIQNAPIGIEIYDRTGHLVDINARDLEMFGVTDPAGIRGLSIFDNPNFSAEIKDCIREGRGTDFTTRYDFSKARSYYDTSRSGYIDWTARIRCLYNDTGEITHYLLINIDNTELRQTQDRLTEFEALFRLISEYAQDDKTVETGKVTFFSRTKNRLWTKGEESGNFLHVVSIKADCDNDTLLIQADPAGPVCHTGTDTCWGEKNEEPVMFLKALQDFIDKRHEEMPQGSYTTSLFESGINKIAQKVGEEAVETVIEATNGTNERLIYEGADLIYHMIVLLTSKGYRIEDLARELQERHSSTWKKH